MGNGNQKKVVGKQLIKNKSILLQIYSVTIMMHISEVIEGGWLSSATDQL